MRLIFLLIAMFGVITLNAQNKEVSNKHFWYSMETTAPPNEIWAVWIDVPNWKNWDTGLNDASIIGEFKLDAKGEIISLENRKSKFKVVEFIKGKSYTYKTKLPLGSLYVKRYVETKDGKTIFTHEVWFKGLTKGIFAKAFGEKFRGMLPDVLTNIKNIIEDNDSN